MLRFTRHFLAYASALIGAAAAGGAVDIADVHVTNVGTSTFTVVWTTSEVSTPALEVFTDSGGTNAITATLGFDYYPFALGDPAVVNDAGARAGRRTLEVLAINRRIVVVRVTGLSPATAYYVRPRTFGPTGTDNGTAPVALQPVTTALFNSMVVDGRLLRVRFPGFSGAGTVALVQGPAGTAPLSALVGDGTEAEAAVFPLAALLDTATGTNALYDSAQPITIRVLGAGAPVGSFVRTVTFGSEFKTAQLETVVSDLATPSPVFTAHPSSRADPVGATATFMATATGTPTPTYKWQRQLATGGAWADLVGDTTYSGVATATLTVNSLTLAMTGDQFRCVATNGLPPDAISNPATLTVSVAQIAVAITTQPQPVAVAPGQTATFTVVATGAPVPTLKWQRQPAVGGAWADLVNDATYAGVTTATLSVRNSSLAMTGDQFRCVVANGVPSEATSTAVVLTVNRSAATVTLANLSAIYDGTSKSVTATTVPPALPVVLTYNGSNSAPTNAGSYAVVATVDDPSFGGSASGTLVIAKADQTITFSALAARVVSDAPFTLGGAASSSLAVGYISSNPAVASISGNVVTLRGPGTTTLTASQPGTANFNAAPAVNQSLVVLPIAPIITSPLAVRGIAGLAFNYTIQTNLTPAAFTAGPLPPGLTFNAPTGVISGTPTVAGLSNVTLVAQNGTGSDTRVLALTIQAPPPLITSALSASGQVGQAFAYTIAADHAPTVFAATGLPSGLSLNPATGAISGSPVQAGSFIATISATNAAGTGSQSLLLTIAPAPDAPVHSGILNPSGTQGAAFNFAPSFTGNPTAFALAAGVLPGGVTLHPTSGAITGIPTEVGAFLVTLRASNAGGPTDVVLQITINPAPSAPAITSASAVSTTVGATFSFTLTASGVPAVYSFTALDRPAWLSLHSGTGVLSGTPSEGVHALRVRASNSPGPGVIQEGPESRLLITVNPSPTAPVITNTPVVPGRVGVPLNFQLTTVPAATGFAITSAAPPAWLNLNPATGLITGTPTTAGPLRVVLAASAPAAGQGRGLEVLFDIAPALLAPEITSGGTAQGNVGQMFRYAITAFNGPITGYALTGTLPAGLVFDAATGVIEGVPPATLSSAAAVTAPGPTSAIVHLTASNTAGTSEAKRLEIVILPPENAPVIIGALDATGQVGSPFSFQILASPSGSSFVALDVLPPGLALNPSTGLVSGTPTAAGTFGVRVVLVDALAVGGGQRHSQPYTVSIVIVPRPGVPRITSLPAANAQVAMDFTYRIEAEPGPILSFNVQDVQRLPDGLVLNTTTGVISGRPTQQAQGSFLLNLTATNGTGVSQPLAFMLTIKPPVGVPVITSAAIDFATVGLARTYTITASNLPEERPLVPPNALNYVGLPPGADGVALPALPPGMAVNPAMGVITGTPTAVGTFRGNLVATNAAGLSSTRSFIMMVQPAAGNSAITSSPTAAGQVGVPFSYLITATNNPVFFEVGNAPSWLTVNRTTGVLGGVPTAPGVFSVAVSARNQAGRAGDGFTIKISIEPAAGTPVITSTRTVTGRLGVPFVYTLSTAPSANEILARGLPAGLAINGATGEIGGTPASSGTFAVTLWAKNGAGEGASTTLLIKILPTLRLVPGR